MFSKNKIFVIFMLVMIVLLGFSVIVYAKFSTFNVYDDTDGINTDNVLDGVCVFFDNNAMISNDINGTTIVSGNTINIDSKIDGDLFLFGNIVEFSGEVTGNLYCFANTLVIKGNVQKDTFILGNIITLSRESNIFRDVSIFGNNVELYSNIGRNVYANCMSIQINGIIGNDIRADIDEINVFDTAYIGGDLLYKSEEEAAIPQNIVIGNIEWNKSETSRTNINKNMSYQGILLEMFSAIFTTLIIWLFVTFFTPRFNKHSEYCFEKKFMRTAFTGLIALICIPVISIILMVTVMGAGLGIILTMLYIIAIYLSFTISKIALANTLVKKFNMKPIHKNIWYVLLLTIIINLLYKVPYLGGLIIFILLITGLGLLLGFLFRKDDTEY